MKTISERKILVGLGAANFLLLIWRLWDPARPYFDEGKYYLAAARSILKSGIDTNFQHPPLSKEILSLGIRVFGDNSFGWRFVEVVLGTAGVITTYFLAKKMFGGRVIPTLSSLLLIFEFSWFTNSRLATPEIFLASFSLLSFYFFFSFYKEGGKKLFFLGSLFFGLAFASKWPAVLLLPIILVLIYPRVKVNRSKILIAISAFIFLSALIYLASYSFYLRNHTLADFIGLQKEMYNFHTSVYPALVGELEKSGRKILDYPAWSWLSNGVYTYNYEPGKDFVKTIILFHNPLIFWWAIALILFKLKILSQTKKIVFEEAILMGGFFLFWLPWLFTIRPVYPYYLLSGMPFATILLAKFLGDRYKKDKYFVWGVMIVAGLLFVIYYPLLSNWPVKGGYLHLLTGYWIN